jgi:hypothetical protein
LAIGRAVLLAGISTGNYQYFAFDKDEFELFAQAVALMRDLVRQSSSAAPPQSAV